MAWLHRAVIAGLLLAAYLWAWTPARTVWTVQSAALLEQVAGETDAVSARPRSHVLRFSTPERQTFDYTAPAGVKFLLPATALVLIAPRRPRLGLFFAGHLGLGALALGLYASGAAGWHGGFWIGQFTQAYGVDAYSLAVPVLVWVRSRSGRSP